MALKADVRRELLAASLPSSEVLRSELNRYLARTGLSIDDFASRINYSPVTVRFFIKGRYEKVASNSDAIRSAIQQFMQAHPVGESEEVEAGTLHETGNVKVLRRYFGEAVDVGRAIVIEGNPGTQKSFVLRRLVGDLNTTELAKNGHGKRAFYVYCEPNTNTPTKMLKQVAEACGSISTGDAHRITRNLLFDFAKRRVVLVIDEVQHANVDCLEALRVLHDRPPHFGLLLAGSHELRRMFTRNAVQLEQWNSRLHTMRTLAGITEDEARAIIAEELHGYPSGKMKALIKGSYAEALGSGGEKRYISARRLFRTITGIKERQSVAAVAR